MKRIFWAAGMLAAICAAGAAQANPVTINLAGCHRIGIVDSSDTSIQFKNTSSNPIPKLAWVQVTLEYSVGAGRTTTLHESSQMGADINPGVSLDFHDMMPKNPVVSCSATSTFDPVRLNEQEQDQKVQHH